MDPKKYTHLVCPFNYYKEDDAKEAVVTICDCPKSCPEEDIEECWDRYENAVNSKKKIFIIAAVRNATPEFKGKLENYVAGLEKEGHDVYLPHRDTNQENRGIEICTDNRNAINKCNEVHLFYDPNSTGTHFDMGIAWALGKKLVVVENIEYGPGKSYPRMAAEWEEEGPGELKEYWYEFKCKQ